MKKSITFLSAISFLGGVLGRGLSYLLSIILGRTIGAVGLGAFAVGFVILRLGGSIAALGMDTAAQKFIPPYLKDEREDLVAGTSASLLFVPLVFGIILAIAVTFIVTEFSIYMGAERTVVLTFVWGIPFLGIIHTAIGVSKAYKETIYEVMVNQFVRPIGAIALIVIAYSLTHELDLMADAYLVSIIIASITSIWVLFHLGAFIEIRSASVEFRRLISYSLPVTIVSISYPLVIWTDILLLGYFVSGEIVGQYQASYQTASLLTFALASVNSIYPSVASEMYSNNNQDGLSNSFSSITKWIAGFSIFAGFYQIIFADEILQIFGTQFQDAPQILVILVIGQVAVSIVGPAGYLLSMAGYERVETVNSIIMAVGNLLLNLVLIQTWGVLGAAVATSISITVLNIARLIEVWVLLEIQPYDKEFLRIVPALILSVGSMILVQRLDVGYLLTLIVGGCTAGTIFLIVMWMVAYTNRDQIILDTA